MTRLLVLVVLVATTAAAAVLCARPRPDGTSAATVKIRERGTTREVHLDPVALGQQGPKGEQGDKGEPGAPGLPAWERSCSPDAVRSGDICIDTSEASVWRIPPGATTVVEHVRDGTVTLEALTGAGATPLGVGGDDYAPCADSGQSCTDDIFAVSLPGVKPSTYITWFQAQAACENSRKRLPTNAEWQAAVMGTPDRGADNGTTDCHTADAPAAVNTGSRRGCRSADGGSDVVSKLSSKPPSRRPICTPRGGALSPACRRPSATS